MKYEDITFEMLGTKRQRPMMVCEFKKFRSNMDMKTYPDDPHGYTKEFLEYIDYWIKSHKRVKYHGLNNFKRKDAILGTTHQLDELHHLNKGRIATYKGEYKYHRRLTDFKVKQIKSFEELKFGDVFIVSYPSCITTNYHKDFSLLLDHCEEHQIPVHIDGAWYGQCRNFEFDVSHPAIHSVSVSLSKALGMGSQRIGIRYTHTPPLGPIKIMNDFNYANVSDMWIGMGAMKHFGVDFWWNNYEDLYEKVCEDFNLIECDSIHIGMLDEGRHGINPYGIRTPLRFLIDGIFDDRGTDNSLNKIEIEERK